jgi:hypothetical protein
MDQRARAIAISLETKSGNKCTVPYLTTATAYTMLKNQFIPFYNFTSFARSTTGQMPALV